MAGTVKEPNEFAKKKSNSKGVYLSVTFWITLCVIFTVSISNMVMYCTGRPNEPNVTVASIDGNNPNLGTGNKNVGGNTLPPDAIYLSEITSFYEQVITLLLAVIGSILGLIFIYVHSTSRRQADELARNAIDDEGFKLKLADMISKEIGKSFAEKEIPRLISELEEFGENSDALFKRIEDIQERFEFVEKSTTKKSYGDLKEAADGNH